MSAGADRMAGICTLMSCGSGTGAYLAEELYDSENDSSSARQNTWHRVNLPDRMTSRVSGAK